MFDVRLEGETRRLMRHLSRLSDLDKKDINAAIGESIRTSTVERFKESKAPDGRRWATSQRASTEGGKTLVDTARLRNSIRSKSNATGFAVGTNVIYASTHQRGEKGRTIRAKTSKGLRFCVGGRWVNVKKVRIKIPPRPFLGLSEDDLLEIKGTLEDALRPD